MNADKITAEFSGSIKYSIEHGVIELLARNIEPYMEARRGHRIYKVTVRVTDALDIGSPTRGDRITAEIYGNDVDDLILRIKDLLRGIGHSKKTISFNATVQIQDICCFPHLKKSEELAVE